MILAGKVSTLTKILAHKVSTLTMILAGKVSTLTMILAGKVSTLTMILAGKVSTLTMMMAELTELSLETPPALLPTCESVRSLLREDHRLTATNNNSIKTFSIS